MLKLVTSGDGYERTLRVEDAGGGGLEIAVSALVVVDHGADGLHTESSYAAIVLDHSQVTRLIAALAPLSE